jgi:hypothetical protein
MATITPYAAAQVTNRVLEAKGINRTITPQMMYGYAKSGRINTVKVEGDKKVYFDVEAFKSWLDQYLKGGAGNARQDYDELAKQFM